MNLLDNSLMNVKMTSLPAARIVLGSGDLKYYYIISQFAKYISLIPHMPIGITENQISMLLVNMLLHPH